MFLEKWKQFYSENLMVDSEGKIFTKYNTSTDNVPYRSSHHRLYVITGLHTAVKYSFEWKFYHFREVIYRNIFLSVQLEGEYFFLLCTTITIFSSPLLVIFLFTHVININEKKVKNTQVSSLNEQK